MLAVLALLGGLLATGVAGAIVDALRQERVAQAG